MQRFGSSLNLNVHFHVIEMDGVYEQQSDSVCLVREVDFLWNLHNGQRKRKYQPRPPVDGEPDTGTVRTLRGLYCHD